MVHIALARDGRPVAAAVRELLVATDAEFHPPLSARSGPTQTSDLDAGGAGAIDDYHAALLDQQFLLALVDDGVVGLCSFRHDYATDALAGHVPSNYASTLAVAPDYRRQGIARRFYRVLLTDLPPDLRAPYVATRTWSENEGHRELLDELGFDRVTVREDDRGEGIDTEYYAVATDDPALPW